LSIQHALLGLLEDEARHGYDLKRLWDERFAQLRPLRFSQIYASLGRLERDGLIRLVGEEPGHGPDRKRYAITKAGARDLDDWLAEPESPEAPVRSTLFLKVVLALASGRPATRFLEAQRAAHTERMRELVALKDEADDVDEALLDYAVFHLDADLRWIDHVAKRLDQLRASLAET
jgi:DNA-binding PadR family transcriptional regulator